MGYSAFDGHAASAWNAGRKVGSKRALKQKEVWAIRFWLEQERRVRDRALFDLAIDSKPHGCDLVRVRIGDLVNGTKVRDRTLVVQRKTGRPVQFKILEPARTALLAWLERHGGTTEDHAFPSRVQSHRPSQYPPVWPASGWGCLRSDSKRKIMALTHCEERRRP